MQHLQKTGGGVPIMVNQVLETSHLPSSPALRLCGCPVFHSPCTLPSSVSRNSFVCHSCENCRGAYQQFPIWFVSLSIGNAERKDRARQAPPHTYGGWRRERSAKT